MTARTLKVAAIQMESRNGDVAGNLARAGRWADAAARQGAQLVLLPELFSTGFEINANAWRSAEPRGGATESWLSATASRHGFHIGGSYLEARGEDFFNTFALAAPDGTIAGRVRKAHPCSFEAYAFKGGEDPRVIPTALGRIGVAICYDGCLRATWDDMLPRDPDLVLMPLSAPAPMKTFFYGRKRIDAFLAAFRTAATDTAAGLGIPVLLANKWGPWDTTLPGIWPRQTSHFPGFSHIADSDGREGARMGDGEGVIVAPVHLAPERKRLSLRPEAEGFRPWIFEVPPEFKFFRWFEALGRRWYARHPDRARLAKQAAEAVTQ